MIASGMDGAAVKGWCPGALRPMESGDGLIVRLKIAGGIVPLALAAKIADWSALWGNSEIDLTSRANLQLRGVSAETLEPLRGALAEAGLLDADPDGEAVRNVVASPLAGIDPAAILDISPVVAGLEARLVADKRLHALPAKFCFGVDDGGRFGPGGIAADIGFEARAGADRPIFAIYLDGGGDWRIASCAPDEVAEAATLLALGFLAQQRKLGSHIHRMRDLVAAVGIQGLTGRKTLEPRRRDKATLPVLGAQSLNNAPGTPGAFLALGLPLGRVSAEDMACLAAAAANHGAADLRLTSQRGIFVPLPDYRAARNLAGDLPAQAFILLPDDPILSVAACVGAPACPRATTRVRHDARHLAFLASDAGIALHVSGCRKGCAHPRAAPVTLVGDRGFYDLVIDGKPSDSPSATGLTLDEAAAHLRQMAEQNAQGGTV